MAQQSGEGLENCVECGNVVSMMYVLNEGDIWCLTCWDAKCEEEEEESAGKDERT
jgi:hypothetical protein